MKVLIIDWNSYGNMEPVYVRRGAQVSKCTIDTHAVGDARLLQEKDVENRIVEFDPDYVFSYNYFPFVSEICQKNSVPYVSWIYDSPFMDLYSYTVINSVNHIYVFDYAVFAEFERAGIKTVKYLPLGVDIGAVDTLIGTADSEVKANYAADISFVGSLYTEPKHRLYDKFNSLPDYTKGYIDALILAQKNIYGENIFESFLTEEIISELEKCYPTDPNPTTAMTPAQIYSQFVLCRQVTGIERKEILELLGSLNAKKKLYTQDASVDIAGWEVNGPVDYYTRMPIVFSGSKINLNITLRSIQTGIPLRAMDIMAAGGFLLTNYQAEFCEYFTAGEDFVFYEDYEDLKAKVKYYLEHEEERKRIALNGHSKVRKEHNIDLRIDIIEAAL